MPLPFSLNTVVQTSQSAYAPAPAPAAPRYDAPLPSSEFDYRPVPVLVPISLGLAILGLTGFLSEWLLILGILAAAFSALAWRKIATSEGSYSGAGMAKGVLVASAVMVASAASMHAWAYATEVPEGFRRVNFTADISQKGLQIVQGQAQVPPDVRELDKQPVFIKGYMYPTKDTQNLDTFLLCRDSGDCCFGGTPKLTDMIAVKMPADQAAHFRAGLVAVAGTFFTENDVDAAGFNPVYRLEAEHFYAPAKTAY